MKIKHFVLVWIVAILSGCAGPAKKDQAAKIAVTQQQAKIEQNVSGQKDHGRDFAFAAQFALSLESTPSDQSKVALTMLDRSMTLLGSPDYNETLVLKEMIHGLLSTNEALRVHAEKVLSAKDQEISGLQNQNKANEDKLKTLLAHLDKVTAENAANAQTWVTIKRIFYWFVWGSIIIVVLRVGLACCPPPYNEIGHIPDWIFGKISALLLKVPSAAKYAGVVSSDLFNKYRTTLTHTVDGIDQAMDHYAVKNPTALADLKGFLNKATSSEVSRPLIAQVKATL